MTRSGIEVVITGLTRNQFDGNVTWVRIPPTPLHKNVSIDKMLAFLLCTYCAQHLFWYILNNMILSVII
jgi:hypothetical protein